MGSQQLGQSQNQTTIGLSPLMVNQLDQALLKDQHKFFLEQYQIHNNEKGNLYTWGSGEMG